MMYKYGMRLRPFSIGCQPKKGFEAVYEDITGKYWNIILYNRKLEDKEVKEYELYYLGEEIEQ